ncbi:MAG: putative AAA+ superfamily ATPase [Phenylobacterium sp.]|jgi:predicted AAA+ superfamily ATPase
MKLPHKKVYLMQRLLLSELLDWQAQEKRKPVLLDGARQVGKSYLLKSIFAPRHFDRFHIIDFMKTPDAAALFEQDLNPLRLLEDLSFYLDTEINPQTDLIIFDEIGECHKAVLSLKFIAEEHPDWFVCATGSNIGLLDSFPVGKVHGLTLRPMNFAEFLLATGSKPKQAAFERMDRRALAHTQLWPVLVDYFFVGGMPEAVATWFANKDEALVTRQRKVRQTQRDILNGYQRDFGKYSGRVNALHIHQVFESVAGQLQKNREGSVKRYIFKEVIEKKNSYRDFANIISWLEVTNLVSKCYVINQQPRTPLRAARKATFFKLFYLDIGLLSCELGIKGSALAMGDMIYKGPVAENFVQNELLSYGLRETYSWSENTAEIEFIIESLTDGIIPVEVKAGSSTKAKSLRSYQQRYAPDKTLKLIGAVGGTDDVEQVLPLYYASYAVPR